jgi:hypothetical protein
MKKYRVKVKCVQTVEFVFPEEAWYDVDGNPRNAEQIKELEIENVKSDPTYFNSFEDAIDEVEVEVEDA